MKGGSENGRETWIKRRGNGRGYGREMGRYNKLKHTNYKRYWRESKVTNSQETGHSKPKGSKIKLLFQQDIHTTLRCRNVCRKDNLFGRLIHKLVNGGRKHREYCAGQTFMELTATSFYLKANLVIRTK